MLRYVYACFYGMTNSCSGCLMVNSVPRFMPKPRPTTDACNRNFETFCVGLRSGLPMDSANANPRANASGGET